MPKLILIPFFMLISYSLAYSQDQGTQTGEPSDSAQNQLPSLEDLLNSDSAKVNRSRFLALEKRGKNKRIRFYPGDKIVFQLKNDPNIYQPIIEQVSDNSITVYDTKIPLSEIKYIYIRPKRRLIRLVKSFLFIFGIGYIVIDAVNHSFTTNRDVLVTGGSSVGIASALSLLTARRKLKLNKHRYLKTIIRF